MRPENDPYGEPTEYRVMNQPSEERCNPAVTLIWACTAIVVVAFWWTVLTAIFVWSGVL